MALNDFMAVLQGFDSRLLNLYPGPSRPGKTDN